MIVVQTMLGGITRLSGSGLSITEWDIVTGTLPPIGEQAWQAAYAKYQLSPQFKYLNSDFGMTEFKSIFFWEWFHRLWARLIGIVFAIPFVFFMVKGYFSQKMVFPLILLFILGALQGAVGWIMVQSGLVGDATYVRPTKLMVHFVFAMILVCYTLYMALSLLSRPGIASTPMPRLAAWYAILLLTILAQFIFGALLAGHKAANVAATWPTINGDYIPQLSNAHHTWLDNKILIQFVHRTLAYTVFTFTLTLAIIAYRKLEGGMKPYISLSVAFVAIQVLLGILALLSSTSIIPNIWGRFENLAFLHQFTGMILMLSIVALIYFVQSGRRMALKA